MRKLVVLVFVFGLVMLMPRVGEAVALTGQCGWCGGVCRMQTMGQACTDVAPPKNLVCMEEKGMCVVKGENDVAVPTIKYAKEGEKCLGVSVVCESGLECNDSENSAVVGGVCVKTKCLPRPLCLDAVPACKMPELESYCPKVTPTPTSTITTNNVNWSTPWGYFSAANFEIHVSDGTQNGRYFRVNPSKPCNLQTGEKVCLHSNPPYLNSNGLHYMTLEVTWFENDIEMRMNIYFYSDRKTWWSDEIRVYNGQPEPNSEWVYFRGKFFESPVGQAFEQNTVFEMSAVDTVSNNAPVTLSFSNFKVNAFMNYVMVEKGDANGDGKVDLVDFAVWKNEYLTTIGLTADFNKDEKVDLIDFSIWKVAYLTK